MTTPRELAQELVSEDEELIFADGLDDALIGVVERFGLEPIALYDRDKVIEIFMADSAPEGWAEDGEAWVQAEEHFGFNVIGAWVGDKTPAYTKLLPGKRPLELDDKASQAAMEKFLRSDSSYQTSSAWACGRDAWNAAIAWVKEQQGEG